MKLVIPIETEKRNSQLSKKFARSEYFAVIQKEEATIEIVKNPFLELKMGVGQKLITWLKTEHSVDVLVAFELGLKVQQLANIEQLQLIIINEKKQSLKQLMAFMQMT